MAAGEDPRWGFGKLTGRGGAGSCRPADSDRPSNLSVSFESDQTVEPQPPLKIATPTTPHPSAQIADQMFVKLVGLRAMRCAQIIHSRQIKQINARGRSGGWLLFPANHMREGRGWRHRRW
jgi:hypothetical protein